MSAGIRTHNLSPAPTDGAYTFLIGLTPNARPGRAMVLVDVPSLAIICATSGDAVNDLEVHSCIRVHILDNDITI